MGCWLLTIWLGPKVDLIYVNWKSSERKKIFSSKAKNGKTIMKCKHLRIPISPQAWIHGKAVRSFWEGDELSLVSLMKLRILMRCRTYHCTSTDWPGWLGEHLFNKYFRVDTNLTCLNCRFLCVRVPATRNGAGLAPHRAVKYSSSPEHQRSPETQNWTVMRGIFFNAEIQNLKNVCVFIQQKTFSGKKYLSES